MPLFSCAIESNIVACNSLELNFSCATKKASASAWLPIQNNDSMVCNERQGRKIYKLVANAYCLPVSLLRLASCSVVSNLLSKLKNQHARCSPTRRKRRPRHWPVAPFDKWIAIDISCQLHCVAASMPQTETSSPTQIIGAAAYSLSASIRLLG